MFDINVKNSDVTKVIRDNKVAVIISSDYGAGWYSWHKNKDTNLIFDPTLVKLVEEQNYRELTKYVNSQYPDVYHGKNILQLKVEWVPIGSVFRIAEYDGAEFIEYLNDTVWIKA